MNYLEWSHEYEETAAVLDKVLQRLQRQRKGKSAAAQRELTDKIAYYKSCRNDCLRIAGHLRERHKGVA